MSAEVQPQADRLRPMHRVDVTGGVVPVKFGGRGASPPAGLVVSASACMFRSGIGSKAGGRPGRWRKILSDPVPIERTGMALQGRAPASGMTAMPVVRPASRVTATWTARMAHSPPSSTRSGEPLLL